MCPSNYKRAHAIQQRSPLLYGDLITLNDYFHSWGHISIYISQKKSHGGWLHNSQTALLASIIYLFLLYLICTAWMFQVMKRSWKQDSPREPSVKALIFTVISTGTWADTSSISTSRRVRSIGTFPGCCGTLSDAFSWATKALEHDDCRSSKVERNCYNLPRICLWKCPCGCHHLIKTRYYRWDWETTNLLSLTHRAELLFLTKAHAPYNLLTLEMFIILFLLSECHTLLLVTSLQQITEHTTILL